MSMSANRLYLGLIPEEQRKGDGERLTSGVKGFGIRDNIGLAIPGL